jgi:hypothetical protein
MTHVAIAIRNASVRKVGTLVTLLGYISKMGIQEDCTTKEMHDKKRKSGICDR